MKKYFSRLKFFIRYYSLVLQSRLDFLLKRYPFVKDRSIPISKNDLFFQETPAKLTRILLSNLTIQFNGAACSVASTVTVLNSLREFLYKKTCFESPISQKEVLERVKTIHWKERMGENGYKGRRGLPVRELGLVVNASLKEFNLTHQEVKTIPLLKKMPNLDQLKKELLEDLICFENNSKSLIIAHFNQAVFIGDLHVPHISPVGAFDIKQNQVLMLDVDPEVNSPYWVSFNTFFNGLTWEYNHLMQKYGYNGGGYIKILL